VGDEASKALKPVISADEFAENILGFEEVEEGEDEAELAEGAQMGDTARKTNFG
jgi:hypothetical protein